MKSTPFNSPRAPAPAGGYAQAKFNGSSGILALAPFGPTGLTLPNQTFSGYFLATGMEVMIAPGWFVKSEYRYADYGSKTLTDVGDPAFVAFSTGATTTIKPVVQTVRTELVYKFNWGS